MENNTNTAQPQYELPKEIEMPSGLVLNEEHRISAYMNWRANNHYSGKNFSILGDAISTLDGFNPEGSKVYYEGENCEKSGVKNPLNTWWGKVITYYGGLFLVNDSYAGSRVTRMPGSTVRYPSGCSDERTSGLHKDGTMPDVIIVMLGFNDWGYDVKPVFCESDEDAATPLDREFRYAYNDMLDKLRANYPDAEIWCCTMCKTDVSSMDDFEFPEYTEDESFERFNKVIFAAAVNHNCRYIDLNRYDDPYDTIDGIHPNAKGMRNIACKILRCVTPEVRFFIDCMGGHDLRETTALDGRKVMVCNKCGAVVDIPPAAVEETQPAPEEAAAPAPAPQQPAPEPAPAPQQQNVELVPPSEPIRLDNDIEYAKVLLLRVNDTGEQLAIQKDTATVGRHHSCDIFFDPEKNNEYKSVTRFHGTFIYENSKWYYMDNSSTNGSYINSVRLEPRKNYQLKNGDVLHFGNKASVVFYPQPQ